MRLFETYRLVRIIALNKLERQGLAGAGGGGYLAERKNLKRRKFYLKKGGGVIYKGEGIYSESVCIILEFARNLSLMRIKMDFNREIFNI